MAFSQTACASPPFLSSVKALSGRSAQKDSAIEIQRATAEIKALQRKRERVIDSFVEGVILPAERDRRLTAINDGLRLTQATLAREAIETTIDTGKLIDAFTPLAEWAYWTRDQKRVVFRL
jgi:hypothetical protein